MSWESTPAPDLAAQVLAGLPTPVLACDDAGRVVFANAAVATLLRRDEATLIGAQLEQLIALRGRTVGGEPTHQVLVARAARREQSPLRIPLVRDGLEIEVECTPAPGPGGLLILSLAYIHDATEARGRPGSHQLIFEHAPLGILHFDRTGVITDCNDTFVAIIGSSRRILVGLNMLTLPDGEMVRCVRAALAGELAGYEGDYRSATSGKVTPVSVIMAPVLEDDAITGCVGIVRDDSERKAAMTALRESEASFRALIEGAPDAIAVVHDRRLVYANPTLARLLGHGEASTIRGATIDDLLHPDDRAQVPTTLAFDDERGPPPLAILRWRRGDGRLVETEAVVVPIRFGGAAGVAVVARDVTEANLLRARLSRADRLAALGTLAAGVAHEINNPLAYLMASLETALRALRRPKPTSVDHLIDRALDGARRVRRIVRDLRLFSSPDDAQLAPIDLHAVLDSAENLCTGEIKHRAQLDKNYQPVPAVLGDEIRLGQVFVNILVNAAHAISADRTDGHIAIRTYTTEDGHARIEIADNGVGIPAEQVPHVFEPFVTTKPVGVGTGLGLSICHGLVTALGGEISLESTVGRGTVVRVTLPAASVPVRERSDGPLPPVPRGVPARILIVDDEANLLSSLQIELAERHEVAIAATAEEALELIVAGPDFDLVLCDVMMAVTSGLDLYRMLQRVRPDLIGRFAFMTGGVLSGDIYQAVLATGRPRLDKPFSIDDLEQLLAAAEAPRRAG
jgi:two-component system cell cycle sensor histidine kinase/response regulator CckA